ncbi:type 1 glutamine amidotransferase [Nocardioides terrisoli]|uniref:type 1 glutamine amidotransferase n=1 Tax=Nocardioides terrisoli TaxID=3388267 RepID=UPI00287B9A47|nr:type 1 glutamine amidotransferase [Nocardioides marmorisolisilvae]
MSKILVVQHQSDCPPGWFGDWLLEEGCQLDVRRPDRGEPVGATPQHVGVVVLGGSPNAHDDESAPWLAAVRALCADALAREVPLLGICLGHQLLAVSVGGRSVRNPDGQQIGVLPMGWTETAGADPLLASLPAVAVQWNHDIVVGLPESVQVLARAAGGEVQAARFGPTAWGLQCHPEAGAQICAAWAEHDRGEYAARGEDVSAYVDGVRVAEVALADAWRPVATAFSRLVRSRS